MNSWSFVVLISSVFVVTGACSRDYASRAIAEKQEAWDALKGVARINGKSVDDAKLTYPVCRRDLGYCVSDVATRLGEDNWLALQPQESGYCFPVFVSGRFINLGSQVNVSIQNIAPSDGNPAFWWVLSASFLGSRAYDNVRVQARCILVFKPI